MRAQVGYMINKDVKEDFDNYIASKYGDEVGNHGFELDNALKLYLGVMGDRTEYITDSVMRVMSNLFNRYKKCYNNCNELELFVKEFKKEYKNVKYVTHRELNDFIDLWGIKDPPAVQNRMNYLITKGLIEQVSHNAFSIKKWYDGALRKLDVARGWSMPEGSVRVWYTVEEDVKSDFVGYIDNLNYERGYRKGRQGLELERSIRLYLATTGNNKYVGDSSVQLILRGLDRRIGRYRAQDDHTDLDLLISAFKKDYTHRKYITSEELGYFIGFVEGITNKKSIQNKINYLISKGFLKPVEWGFFEIKDVYTSGLFMKKWNKWFTP